MKVSLFDTKIKDNDKLINSLRNYLQMGSLFLEKLKTLKKIYQII